MCVFLLTTDVRAAEPQSPAMAVDNKTDNSEVCGGCVRMHGMWVWLHMQLILHVCINKMILVVYQTFQLIFQKSFKCQFIYGLCNQSLCCG